MRAVGIILAGGNSRKMRELTSKRAAAAMPIAGSYRAIDFTLSNMTNSHIQKVAVLTQYNARSLNEHLNSSKWWDFGRKQGGLYVFTPTITDDNGYWYRGTADAIYQNLDFLRKCHEPYVIITSGDAVYKMDYNKVLEYHIAKKADITVVCKELAPDEDATRFGTVKMNESCRIEEFEEKPVSRQLEEAISERKNYQASAGDAEFMKVTLDDAGEYTEQAFSTIICEGDAIGAVIICNKDEKKKMNDTEGKLAAAAASFLGRQMEQ